MDPGQHDVGSHVANDVRVVGVEGNICISRPAVGLGGTGRSDVSRDELVEAVAAVVGDAVEAQPARVLPSPPSMLPTTSILPSWLRPAPLAGGSSLVRKGNEVSSISTRPDNGLRSGSTIARRSLAASIQALR